MKYDYTMMKYEYKYLVPNEKLDILRSSIRPFVFDDKYMDLTNGEGYTVRTIYFDTPGYEYFHEKIDGLKIRKKVRIRGYNRYDPESIVYFEIKRKNEKKVSKNRSPVRFSDLGGIFSNGDYRQYVLGENGGQRECEDMRRFLYYVHRDCLQPTLLVVYEREAYLGKYDRSVRLTLDRNLRALFHPTLGGLYGEDHVCHPTPDHFVLEVKFYHTFPSWLKKNIYMLELQRGAFSKYANCLKKHLIKYNPRQLPRDFVRDLSL
ncbi:VTC domain-containing protein [Candidatus Latescibacterota bacterium]